MVAPVTTRGPSPAELARTRLAFALDYPTLDAARAGAVAVAPSAGVLKVGLQLFIREGAAAVALGSACGCEVFLDLKLHDIPATVDGAVASVAALGARYVTVHAGGGPAMLEAAVSRAQKERTGLRVLGVTVMTSLDASDLQAVGVAGEASAQVERLAALALAAGVDGLVCSPEEVPRLRRLHGETPLLVTPGIRPAGAEHGDQKRVGTPASAIQAGASLLVVGRPIRDAQEPGRAAGAIVREIEAALA